MFSDRIPRSFAPNALEVVRRRLVAAGTAFDDLTATNPTQVGLDYPADLLAGMSDPRALRYAPDPSGLLSAREAVAADYARRGHVVDAERVLLFASTSEAYALLFKLLADPGDGVLVPRPSYPLFDHLARLEGLEVVDLWLDGLGGWMVARERVPDLEAARCRAVLLVSPNNPTGSRLHPDDAQWIDALAARSGAAVILDEVFDDYDHDDRTPAHERAGRPPKEALWFRLGGLSKTVGLPQAKLGWCAVEGPAALVGQAVERLEFVNDQYLSASTSVQVAAADLLARGALVRELIRARLSENLNALRGLVAAAPWATLLAPQAGWHAVFRVPATTPDWESVTRLLRDDHVLVHPGELYGFADAGWRVVSLLCEPASFVRGLTRVLAPAP